MKKRVALTLRLDEAIYDHLKSESRREGVSLASYVQDAVAVKLVEAERDMLFDAFTLVGKAAGEESVEFAIGAQREVIE